MLQCLPHLTWFPMNGDYLIFSGQNFTWFDFHVSRYLQTKVYLVWISQTHLVVVHYIWSWAPSVWGRFPSLTPEELEHPANNYRKLTLQTLVISKPYKNDCKLGITKNDFLEGGFNELFKIFLNEINVFDIIQHIYISYWI